MVAKQAERLRSTHGPAAAQEPTLTNPMLIPASFDSIRIPLAMVDLQWKVLDANAAFVGSLSTLQLASSDVVGHSLRELVAPEDVRRLMATGQQLCLGCTGRFDTVTDPTRFIDVRFERSSPPPPPPPPLAVENHGGGKRAAHLSGRAADRPSPPRASSIWGTTDPHCSAQGSATCTGCAGCAGAPFSAGAARKSSRLWKVMELRLTLMKDGEGHPAGYSIAEAVPGLRGGVEFAQGMTTPLVRPYRLFNILKTRAARGLSGATRGALAQDTPEAAAAPPPAPQPAAMDLT